MRSTRRAERRPPARSTLRRIRNLASYGRSLLAEVGTSEWIAQGFRRPYGETIVLYFRRPVLISPGKGTRIQGSFVSFAPSDQSFIRIPERDPWAGKHQRVVPRRENRWLFVQVHVLQRAEATQKARKRRMVVHPDLAATREMSSNWAHCSWKKPTEDTVVAVRERLLMCISSNNFRSLLNRLDAGERWPCRD